MDVDGRHEFWNSWAKFQYSSLMFLGLAASESLCTVGRAAATSGAVRARRDRTSLAWLIRPEPYENIP